MHRPCIACVCLLTLCWFQLGQSWIIAHNSISRAVGKKQNPSSLCLSSNDKVINNSDINEQSILICGDGDLSFSAFLSNEITKSKDIVLLVGTVLEDKETHKTVYKGSADNERLILQNGHQVMYGVDATTLQTHFPNQLFDRIQFNFPHWKGKANHRYNRQLIQAFFKSASSVLTPNGRIYMALVDHQGGDNCTSLQEYRDTWTPSMFAAEHGLLLYDVQLFDVTYNLSSHRGVDRGFQIGKHPKLFVYGKPNHNMPIPKQYQQCCRHELHIVVPTPKNDDQRNDSLYSYSDIVHGNAIQNIVQNIVPQGILVHVPARNFLKKEESAYEEDMAVFLIVYCGETHPVMRDDADHYRHLAELEVEKYVPLRENRRGRMVSRPFPYYLLKHTIENHSRRSSKTKESFRENSET